jgi:MFS family permease
LIAAGTVALAIQCAAPVPDARELEQFRKAHRRTQLAGMGVLTGWAVANIAGGIAGAVLVEGDGRFVHQANAAWNTVNLALGIAGLVSNGRRLPKVRSAADARRLSRRTIRTYAINAVLDVVYIAAGTLMAELGRQHGQERVQGYGSAVVLQGAWLFAFDVGMMIAHGRVQR